MNSIDPLRQVAAYRPTTDDIDQHWPAVRRTAVLDQVLTDSPVRPTSTGEGAWASSRDADPIGGAPPPHHFGARRGLIAGALIAAAVTALLLVQFLIPAGQPGGPSAAAALDRLAAAAATEQPLQPGQYRHEIVHSTQNSVTVLQESWTSADGRVWRHDSAGADSRYYAFPAGKGDMNDLSPAFLATLPTEPAALNRYLRTHVSGSTSTDEAVFKAVGDILRGGFAPPALRSTALKVLQMTPHITVEAGHDSLGRPVQTVTFIDQANRPAETQSLLVDPTTAAILESQVRAPGLIYNATVTDQSIVNAVPADVITNAAAQRANPPTAPLGAGASSTQAQQANRNATPASATSIPQTGIAPPATR